MYCRPDPSDINLASIVLTLASCTLPPLLFVRLNPPRSVCVRVFIVRSWFLYSLIDVSRAILHTSTKSIFSIVGINIHLAPF